MDINNICDFCIHKDEPADGDVCNYCGELGTNACNYEPKEMKVKVEFKKYEPHFDFEELFDEI